MALRLGRHGSDFQAETTQDRSVLSSMARRFLGDSIVRTRRISRRLAPPSSAIWRGSNPNSTAQRQDYRAFRRSGRSAFGWAKDIEERRKVRRSTIRSSATPTSPSAKLYDMLPAESTRAIPANAGGGHQTVRNVYVIGPDKKLKLILIYPMTTGRNFDEGWLRVIDSMQLTAKHKGRDSGQLEQGEDVIIAGSVSDEDAKKTYPQGWKAPKPYIRIVPQPPLV